VSEEDEDIVFVGLVFLLGFVLTFGAVCVLFLLPACGATYTNTAVVETSWLGTVTKVDGGTTTPKALGGNPLAGILDTLWSLTGLLCVLGLLLLLLAWKVPAVRALLTLKHLRAKKLSP
jgi:hypothetical protein